MSARLSSASESAIAHAAHAGALAQGMTAGETHLWLCHRSRTESSEHFRRSVLATYTGRAAEALTFSIGEHGKPELQIPQSAIVFNVSHSHDWLVCAVAADGCVGVDLEEVCHQRNVMAIARRFFAASEVAALESLPESGRADAFYDLWTLKEAAVKVLGEPLWPHLATFSFTLCDQMRDDQAQSSPGAITPLGADQQGLQFQLFEPLDGLRLALCRQLRSGILSPQVQMHIEYADGRCVGHCAAARAGTPVFARRD